MQMGPMVPLGAKVSKGKPDLLVPLVLPVKTEKMALQSPHQLVTAALWVRLVLLARPVNLVRPVKKVHAVKKVPMVAMVNLVWTVLKVTPGKRDIKGNPDQLVSLVQLVRRARMDTPELKVTPATPVTLDLLVETVNLEHPATLQVLSDPLDPLVPMVNPVLMVVKEKEDQLDPPVP